MFLFTEEQATYIFMGQTNYLLIFKITLLILKLILYLFVEAAYLYNAVSAKLSDKTLCMVARQGDNNELLHYNVHSLYGWSQSLPTLQ